MHRFRTSFIIKPITIHVLNLSSFNFVNIRSQTSRVVACSSLSCLIDAQNEFYYWTDHELISSSFNFVNIPSQTESSSSLFMPGLFRLQADVERNFNELNTRSYSNGLIRLSVVVKQCSYASIPVKYLYSTSNLSYTIVSKLIPRAFFLKLNTYTLILNLNLSI